MKKGEAMTMMREAVQAWSEVNRAPSLASYWAGHIDGVKWALRVLESEDGHVG